jgi:hypothetical protein
VTTTFAVAVVKDEADIIEGFVLHAARHTDHVIVADNNSTDGTRDMLADLAKATPLTVVDHPEVAYRQWEVTSRLAAAAGDRGARWVVPMDADELWHPVGRGRLADMLADVPPTYQIVQALRYTHVRTTIDDDAPDPFRSMVWRRREAETPPKVAFRWREGALVHQGNHGATLDPGRAAIGEPAPPTLTAPLVQVRHFPVRSADQLIGKVRNGIRAYEADPSLPKGWAVHWRAWGRLLELRGEDALREVFEQYWSHLSPLDASLVYDPAPYRLEERADAA